MNKYIQKGFTLVEILMVIALIGFLIAFLLPNFSGVGSKKNDLEKKNVVKDVVNAVQMVYIETGAYPEGRFCVDNLKDGQEAQNTDADDSNELDILSQLDNQVPTVGATNLNYDAYCAGDGTKAYYEKLENSDNGNFAVYMMTEDSSNQTHSLHVTTDGNGEVTDILGIEHSVEVNGQPTEVLGSDSEVKVYAVVK